MKKKFIIFAVILTIIMVAMTACTTTVKVSAPTATPAPVVTAPPTPTPVPERIGSYLDSINMFKVSGDTAAQQVLDGTLDIYASGLYQDQLTSIENSFIELTESTSRQYELLVNPADTDKGLNPFKYKEIREALNTLIDRIFIKDNIFNGNAIANSSPIIYGSKDYNTYKQSIDSLNTTYVYDFDKATKVISDVLSNVKYVTQDEKSRWLYKDEPITIIILIRKDDTNRSSIGEYVSAKLEEAGFAVERRYLSQTECNSLWAGSDPEDGTWHLYTGRRTFEALPPNMDGIFLDQYTSSGAYSDIPLYKSFDVSDEFLDSAIHLADKKYLDTNERNNVFTSLLTACTQLSYKICLVDELVKSPHTPKLALQSNLSTSLDNDYATVFTLQKKESWGGQINWGTSDLLSSPANPVGGLASEKQYLNFTELPLVAQNNDTGITKPMFIESANVVFESSLNYIDDCEWVETSTSDEIKVPNDAIISWDDNEEHIIYADNDYLHDKVGLATAWLATYERERPKDRDKIKRQKEIISELQAIEDRGYLTCNVKYTVEYDDSIFNLKWQDGSPLSIADIVMSYMTKKHVVTKDSSLYDEYIGEKYGDMLNDLMGFKVISTSPLVIEYYTDSHDLYVSNNLKPLWVDYFSGQQSWGVAAVAQNLINEGSAFYTEGAAKDNSAVWLDYLKGDSLTLLEQSSTTLSQDSFIPYKELLEQYVTPEDVKLRYDNIIKFYNEHGHFAIGLGPYVINNVDPLAPSLTLVHYDGLSIPADKLASYYTSD